MFKKIILVLAGIFLFFWGKIAFANVYINEIMYAPANTGGECIEIFNSSKESVDLTDWRFFNNKDDSSPLRLQKGSATLIGGGYAIITSSSNWNSFTGTVFSSSQFSLPDDSSKYNTYKAIADSNKQIIDSIIYDTKLGGDKESGNSLSKINGVWQSALPTIGLQNYISDGISQSNDDSNISNNNSLIQPKFETKTKIIEPATIKTKIIAQNLAFVGTPFELKANILGYSGETLNYGKCFWNFGDGDSKEQVNNFYKFFHTYSYPGEYTISLEYYSNYYLENPDAVNKIMIKVVPLSVVISKVGDEKDFFIELSNNSDYEVDISKWVLISLNKVFVLPRNTILLKKNKIILSPQITNLGVGDEKNLKLIKPTGDVAFDYGTLNFNKQIYSSNNIKDSITPEIKPKDVTLEKINKKSNVQDFDDDLTASVVKNDFVSSESNSYLFFIIFVILLGVSSGIVYFIRRKKYVPQEGDDFEILDE